MTTTEANVSDSTFPVTWERPGDDLKYWFQDVMHNPLPVSPINATLFQPAFAEGAGRSMNRLSLPIKSFTVSVQNGFVYIGRDYVEGTPEELEARMLEMQRLTMELGATVLDDWRSTFEPQVHALAKPILEFDYDGSTPQRIAEFAKSFYGGLVEAWDIHMRVNIPPMGAVFGMEEFLTEVLGEDAIPPFRQLLQGFDNKSIETARALWEISRWVRATPGLAEAVLAARVRGGAIEMPAHAQADEFRARLKAFLDVYGWRSDRFFEIAHKSWHEDPSTPLTTLKGYIAKDDAQDPFAAHRRQAEERERLTQEMEARFPAEELRHQFRGMLALAQQYIPIAEDHNFTIDQGFTAVVRFGMMGLGRALVRAGRLDDADDVNWLTFDEIQAIAAGDTSQDMRADAKRRREEHVRQSRLSAPIFLGATPPDDMPPDPIVTKFFGVGIEQKGDPSILTGHPCSRGIVTGAAKVVLTLDEADKVHPGDILVCRMTMPAWTPLFGVVAAVVADSGGPLSHCAIVAREYEIPCVAGTVVGTSIITDGMQLRVDGTAGTVTLLDKKRRG